MFMSNNKIKEEKCKKILILTGAYYPNPLANGICVHNIACVLANSGIEVHIICFRKSGESMNEIVENIHVHRIRMRLFFKIRFWGEKRNSSKLGKLAINIALLLNKLKKIIYFPLFPLVSITFICRYLFTAISLQKKNSFNLILKVVNPFESGVAGSIFKIKYPDVKNVLYDLDTLTNNEYPKILPVWIYKHQLKFWERFIYKNSDLILNLNCHKTHFQNKNYDCFFSKMDYIDIPLLKTGLNSGNNRNNKDKEVITFLYAGALSKKMRNPISMCQIFYEISKITNIEVKIFSRGECDEVINRYEKLSNGKIKRYNYVDKKIIDNIVNSTDILISIGNRDSAMIPSKIFEYFSTKKKIIHFYHNEKDTCIPYFKKYPNSLLVNECDDNYININKILQFIKFKGKYINDKDLKTLYYENLPEYTANKIMNFLTNR